MTPCVPDYFRLADNPGVVAQWLRIEMPITANPAGSAFAFTRAENALQWFPGVITSPTYDLSAWYKTGAL